ncbi:MAG TPA: DUF296 domain-containing protein [Thermoanaerobaculia bacterium]|nr:DUF296 domain-containing protein [Thermoanaerobaculia bacterium]HUM28580.1 DUF296 domain-containing protein [Thermoanaerobaculia bacterium]HXK66812.1 DUF296 domain-containing protein [Thermoanaerobaculia bacterium]
MDVWELPYTYVIRLERGEEVITSLKDFADSFHIRGGLFLGLGALSEATLGFFQPQAGDYEKKTFHEDLEILQMTGSLTLLPDEKPLIHIHATLGRSGMESIGGHLFRATISITGEFYCMKPGGAIFRKKKSPEGFLLLSGVEEAP